MTPDGTGLERRHLDRKTPWLVKKYCEAAGIDPSRLGGRGIGIHSLRKTAINDATMHEVREFAGHADIRTTEVYFVRREEDAEVAARRIQIGVLCLSPRKGIVGILRRPNRLPKPCVAKVVSFAIRMHPLDSMAFPCCKSLTQNLRVLQRVLRQANRDADSKSSVFT